MRRALAVLLLFAAACGNKADGTDIATRPVTREPTTAPRVGDRDGYLLSLDFADATTNLAVVVGDERAYALGLLACDQFDAGSSLTDAFDRMMQEPEFAVSNLQTGAAMPVVIVSAVNHLCPEHQAAVQAELGR